MGKKLLRILLFAMLFGALTHVPAWAETAVVTGNEVNMREGPGTEFRIIDCLPRGAEVNVTDRSNHPWYCVEYDGSVGFMSASFLEISEEDSPQPAVDSVTQAILDQGQEGYVDAMYVRFRSAPGSEYSVLGEYNRGKPLLYYGTFGDWAACIIDGRPGFLYADYIALGRFSGWDNAVTDAYTEPQEEEEPEPELPLNLRIMQTPSPTPEYRVPTPSDQLALEHATGTDVEQTPGYINANYVRFRKGPASSYPIIETYNIGTPVGVTGVYMDWTACIIDGAFGFIYSDYITIPSQEPEDTGWEEWQEETTTVTQQVAAVNIPMPDKRFDPVEGYIAGNNVRMRAAPTMSAPVVGEFSYGNALVIVGATDDWAAVICGNQPGYIYGQFVKVGAFELANPRTGSGNAGALSGSSLEKGQQIAQYAVQFVGYPYCWGGKSPSEGFDCSGLVYYVYSRFGITLNRVAQDQAKNGVHVDASELQPGDILCFYSGSSYIGHAGIYIGFGKFVHAQNSATGVVITDLEGHYAERGFEARRIV